MAAVQVTRHLGAEVYCTGSLFEAASGRLSVGGAPQRCDSSSMNHFFLNAAADGPKAGAAAAR